MTLLNISYCVCFSDYDNNTCLLLKYLNNAENYWKQWFSTEGGFVPQETCGDVWSHWGVVRTGREQGCYWHLVGGATDAAKHPAVHSTVP